MANSQVIFTRETNFTGRNGYMKCSGIDLLGISRNELMLSPVTSRGKIGRCDISIPIEDLPALISELQAFVPDDRPKFRVKLNERHYANKDQIIDGYLGNLFNSGEIMLYTRGIAIKKARQFGGKIEAVKSEVTN